MEFFRIRKDIPFMRHALVFNVISLVTFLAAVFFLVHRGLHLSVEFTGGTVLEVQYQQAAELEPVRATLGKLGYGDAQVQSFGTSRNVLIRLALKPGLTSAQQSDQVMAGLKAQNADVQLQRVEFVGPQVGKELATDGLLALACVVIGIVIYLSFRFEWKYAVAGIIANLHDVVIILGFFAFFQWEFSLSVLAAVLAVLGYSVNESVVIFDPDPRDLPPRAQDDGPGGDQPRDHQHHVADHHHPHLDGNDGAVDVLLRRPDPALLRARADGRHHVRHLLVGVRGGFAGDVARHPSRGPDAREEGRARSERSERRRAGLIDPPRLMRKTGLRAVFFFRPRALAHAIGRSR